ncbi:MAG: hypothetical protein PHN64_06640 [Desulfovibrionaceae bacterium]|nr:hypothetical protein [Desulfovibrionaceae bacterium]
MDIQLVIVLALVLLAAVLVVRRFYRSLRGGGCNCGCKDASGASPCAGKSGCPSCSSKPVQAADLHQYKQ